MGVGGISIGRFLLKMFENLLNHLGIFDAGNDIDLTSAALADFNVPQGTLS